MRAVSLFFFVYVWLSASPAVATPPATVGLEPPSAYVSLVQTYCVACHNDRAPAAGLSLQGLDVARVADRPEIWERVARKLRVGAMPPQGARRPDHMVLDGFATWLETTLDRVAASHPDPGAPILHRLNRAEYANAVRDLLALEVGDAATLLPPDDSAFGFDNVTDALGISPVLLERYLAAAGTVSAMAVGDTETSAASETFNVRQDLSQDHHLEGLPLGTIGGIHIRHVFPLDGEYELRGALYRTNTDAIRGLDYPNQIEFAIDGQRVFLVSIGGEADLKALFADPKPNSDLIDARLRVRVPIKAGPHDVTVAFLEKTHGRDTNRLQSFVRSSSDTFSFSGRPHLESVTLTGPFKATGVGNTPSRRRIFQCRPSRSSDQEACARSILTTLARRAFRRSVTKDDVTTLMTFYEAGRKQGGYDHGIQLGLQRILASPQFVFRFERSPDEGISGRAYPLSDFELASRLSFFLWSSIPDDDLLNLAARGELHRPAVLQQQVRRMLVDARSQAFVENFAGQWLELRNLRNMVPNSATFPDFDDNLRDAFREEAELFFASILRENGSVLDLLTADYTFVNQRLAKQYGIPGVYGSWFRRVTVHDDARRGLLGKGAILMVTSHADRTAPVLRGKWVLDNLLGMPPPPPPANVPPLDDTPGKRPRSMREQMETHRSNAVCANCHRLMDPIGLALENFNAVGAWRTLDAGQPINAATDLFDGRHIDGPVALRKALVQRPEIVVRTITEKLLIYAFGRGIDYRDMPTVRAIVASAAGDGYKLSSLISGIVSSPSFQMRTKLPAAPTVESAARGDDNATADTVRRP